MSNTILFSHKQRTIVYLTIIGLIGLGIRLYYYPFELSLTQDAIETYFLYAVDIRQLGHLPTDWTPANNLWPTFLGLVFHVFSSENDMIFFMDLQRSLSIFFSILTLIPVYFLCKKFNDSRLSIIGAAFFILDPRIIQNSLFGITESLYLFIGISSLVLILSENKKYIYLSFVIVAFATLVRAEGMFIFAVISVLYFVQFRKNRRRLLEYCILFIIFILIILPMASYRMDINGNDGIFFRASDSIIGNIESGTINNSLALKAANSAEISFKYLGWIMIPNFIVFVPIGFVLLLKKRNFQTFFILITSVIVSIPAIAAYSSPVLETRYLYILFPMFALMSLITIKKISQNKKISKYIVLLMISGLVLGSFYYLELKKIDYNHEKEAYLIAKQISSKLKIVNHYSESEYLLAGSLNDQWPITSNEFNEIKIVSIEGFESMDELIIDSQKFRLTDIIADDNEDQPLFLKKLMQSEKSYPYLVKKFDSKELGYSYHLKVFEIDYEQFDSLYRSD